MNFTNISQLGTEHFEWLNKLDFYKDDLIVLDKRLAEVASKNSGASARAGIEHFQNQFIIQKNNIDELKHLINENAHRVSAEAKEHGGHVSAESVARYKSTEDQIHAFEKVMNALRQEFQGYLAKWM